MKNPCNILTISDLVICLSRDISNLPWYVATAQSATPPIFPFYYDHLSLLHSLQQAQVSLR